MKSTEKAFLALEELAELDDQEIREALPVPLPPATVRMVIGAAADYIPQDPAELDAFLENVGNFCHALRSDPEPAAIES